MTEAELLSNIRDVAGLFGWLVYHTHDSRRSESGFPDLCMVRGDRLLFCECKTATGKPTPEQLIWLRALSGVKAVEARLWRPEHWDSGETERILR